MTKYCANPDCPGVIRDGRAAEYRDEISVCIDCGGGLMRGVAPDDPHEPPKFSDLRTVCIASDAVQAHLIRGLIENEGIRVYLKGEALSSAIGELPVTVKQIEVQVDGMDVEAARAIVIRFETTRT